MQHRVSLYRLVPVGEGGGGLVEYPDLPSSMSDDETIEEAIANVEDTKRCSSHAASAARRGTGDVQPRWGSRRLDNQTALRLKRKLAEEFRTQLTFGAPTSADEAGLRRLVAQPKAEKLMVKLFLHHPLHAKLYLLFRSDPVNPIVGYLGSSNLTLSGLSDQRELNIDVLDHGAAVKLANWFEERWNDRWCVDIAAELIRAIDESWAREVPLPPYQVYIRMAYHLAQEAHAGLSEFRIPPECGRRIFDYQVAAVKIAAHHLSKRGGVLIGDVVGLGKTLMVAALAKIFQDDQFTETLIVCPSPVPIGSIYTVRKRRDDGDLRAPGDPPRTRSASSASYAELDARFGM